MDKTMTDSITEFIRRLPSDIGKIHSVVLFGSRARGDNAPYSDVDVLVVAESLPEREFARRRLAVEAAKPIFLEKYVGISAVLMTRDEVLDGLESFNPLILEMAKDGIIISDDRDGFFSEVRQKVSRMLSENRVRFNPLLRLWSVVPQ